MRSWITSALEIAGGVLLVAAAAVQFGVSGALATAGVACIAGGYIGGDE